MSCQSIEGSACRVQGAEHAVEGSVFKHENNDMPNIVRQFPHVISSDGSVVVITQPFPLVMRRTCPEVSGTFVASCRGFMRLLTKTLTTIVHETETEQ